MSVAGDSDAPPESVLMTELNASELRLRHPVWRNSVSGASRTDQYEAARFERLSNMAVELDVFRGAHEGADSDIFSDNDSAWRSKQDCQRRKRLVLDTREDHSDTDSDAASDCVPSPRPKRSCTSKRDVQTTSTEAAERRLALGLGPAADATAVDDASCFSDTASEHMKRVSKQVFPCKGVECVGCALAGRISPVSKFISDNIGRMSEENLFKLAALHYKREIVASCRAEGVVAPAWSWKEIHAHYALHVTDEAIARTSTIRMLQNMRYHAESRLVRVKAGQKELDKQGSDLVLKIVAAESKERALLQSYLAAPSAKSRGFSVDFE